MVLQEQSEIPSVAQVRPAEMFPAARALVQAVRNAGARPIFFLTWAHQNGWPENQMPDYASMQAQIDAGYMAIAKELMVDVAPVGDAWATVLAQHRPAEPVAGRRQPSDRRRDVPGRLRLLCLGLPPEPGRAGRLPAGLPADEAVTAQETAAKVVLGNPGNGCVDETIAGSLIRGRCRRSPPRP